MNKEEALELILDYLDTLKIMHSEPEEDDENNIEILFVTEGKDSPGGFIESAITFSDNCILARAYYNSVGQKLVAANLERFPSLFRLMNVINEEKNHLSIQQHSTYFDDDEERSAIFCPQLRMTEDPRSSRRILSPASRWASSPTPSVRPLTSPLLRQPPSPQARISAP